VRWAIILFILVGCQTAAPVTKVEQKSDVEIIKQSLHKVYEALKTVPDSKWKEEAVRPNVTCYQVVVHMEMTLSFCDIQPEEVIFKSKDVL